MKFFFIFTKLFLYIYDKKCSKFFRFLFRILRIILKSYIRYYIKLLIINLILDMTCLICCFKALICLGCRDKIIRKFAYNPPKSCYIFIEINPDDESKFILRSNPDHS